MAYNQKIRPFNRTFKELKLNIKGDPSGVVRGF